MFSVANNLKKSISAGFFIEGDPVILANLFVNFMFGFKATGNGDAVWDFGLLAIVYEI